MILFQYLLKLSVCLSVVFLFYQFVLRRLTFYNRNRWYLLGYSILSFFIPLLNITGVLEKNEWANNEVVNMIPSIDKFTSPVNAGEIIPVSTQWTVWDWTFLFFMLGMLVLFVKLCVQLLSFYKLYRKTELLSKDQVMLYQVNDDIIPFSFGKAIFVNRNLHSEEELTKIIRHEFVHVRQRHIIDVMWSELLCIVNWYNPFAWFIRKAIRQNLEFIADNKVLEEGIDRKQYQYLLLKVMGNKEFSIANQFNFSSLKKRIAMMNKAKSAKLHLLRFLFLLPVVALLLLSFRKNYSRMLRVSHPQQTAAIVTDTIPAEKEKYPDIVASFSLHRDDAMNDTYKDFFKRNDNINLLHWSTNGYVEVYNRNASVESYKIPSELAKFETKYGKLPPPRGSRIRTENGDMIVLVDKIIPGVAVAGYNNADAELMAADRLADQITTVNVKGVGVAATADLAPVTVTGVNLQSKVDLKPVTVTGVSIATTNRVDLTPVTVTGVNIAAADKTPFTLSDVTVTGYGVANADRVSTAGRVQKVDLLEMEGEKVLELKIYKNMKKEDLDNLIKRAKELEAQLTFTETSFNNSGKLTSVSGGLKKGDSHVNFTVTDFEVITIVVSKTADGKYHCYLFTDDKKRKKLEV